MADLSTNHVQSTLKARLAAAAWEMNPRSSPESTAGLVSLNQSDNLRSWRDFARECFCFGSEAMNASGEAVRGLVKSRVEFPPAQIREVF